VPTPIMLQPKASWSTTMHHLEASNAFIQPYGIVGNDCHAYFFLPSGPYLEQRFRYTFAEFHVPQLVDRC
jgi:hypothetical protein